MKVDFFYGDGINIAAADMGYGNRQWKAGDQVALEEWSEEAGSYQEYYTINRFEREASGMGAIVSYSGNSLVNR